MSTKIYTGFRVQTVDMQAILSLLKKPKEQMRAVAKRKFWTERAEIICHIIDAALLGGVGCNLSKAMSEELTEKRKLTLVPYSHSFWLYLDAIGESRKDGTRCPQWDYDCDFNFIPMRDGSSLGTLYAEQQEYYNILTRAKGFKEYGYWNNTDRPDHLSAKQWRQREKDWDSALPTGGVPATRGFTHSLYGKYEQPTYADSEGGLMECQPTLENRALHRATNQVLEGWLKQNVGCAMHEVSEFLMSDQCKAKVIEVIGLIIPKLKPRITDEDAKAEWTLTLP